MDECSKVMKMIVTLCAEEAGIVTVAKSEGSNLDAGKALKLYNCAL